MGLELVNARRTYDFELHYKGDTFVVDKLMHQKAIHDRLKMVWKDYIKHMYISLSTSTESVYCMVTFKKRQSVYIFVIKNHDSENRHVSNSYLFRDYMDLEELMKQVDKDLDKVARTKAGCFDTRMGVLEYDFLKEMWDEGLTIKVTSDEEFRINSFQFLENGTPIENINLRGINIDLIQSLLERGFLKDMKNKPQIDELVISNLGHLAVARNKRLFDTTRFNLLDFFETEECFA